MNDLDGVMEWYVLSRDSNREISKLIKKNNDIFSEGTIFHTKPMAEVNKTLATMQKEMEDFAILAMVSIFEQKMLDVVVNTYDDIKRNYANESQEDALLDFFHEKTLKRWHFNDILDLFKGFAEGIGDIKSIHNYRNWVAHGKHCQKPTTLDPFTVHEKLSKFLEEIRQ